MAYTHIEGAACELSFASAALLKGYDVYMPCVGTQAGHDVVIFKDQRWLRVQVKKGTVMRRPACTYVCAALNGNRNKVIPKDQYDILAIVCQELGKIWFIPVDDVQTEKTISKSIPKLVEWDKYLF